MHGVSLCMRFPCAWRVSVRHLWLPSCANVLLLTLVTLSTYVGVHRKTQGCSNPSGRTATSVTCLLGNGRLPPHHSSPGAALAAGGHRPAAEPVPVHYACCGGEVPSSRAAATLVLQRPPEGGSGRQRATHMLEQLSWAGQAAAPRQQAEAAACRMQQCASVALARCAVMALAARRCGASSSLTFMLVFSALCAQLLALVCCAPGCPCA